ncbi:MAG: DUF1598 domain-containing protein [Pirellulales bacterium]|nr:DUF1598 domain-containing protein [Pirellulales bacterium]
MLNNSRGIAGLRIVAAAMGCALAVALAGGRAMAQNNGNNGNNGTNTVVSTFPSINIVGGIDVSVDGVLSNQDTQQRDALRKARMDALQAVPGDLNRPAPLRMVSLRKLDEQIRQCAEARQPLPDEIKYLAGLQRVQYLFVYPDENDVVIAGPAEGWTINRDGHVVGVATGRPVLHLDDLLVALRYADSARKGGMTASIDPTAEGIQRYHALRAQLTTIGPNPQQTIAAIENAYGPQTITVGGIPPDSRFASVLVAADYRMKRLGMNFEESPVKNMPSFLEIGGAAAGKNRNLLQRWWLAPKYDPLSTDGDGLAWELRGQGVQCMAEEDYFNQMGQRQERRKAGAAAQKWADSMTKNYDELAEKMTVFGDLRNCMDLAVIGALVLQENLLDRANLKLTYLLDSTRLGLEKYHTPKQVPTQASYLKQGREWVISASGGIALQPWFFVEKQEKSTSMAPIRATAAKARNDRWWWN